MSDRIILQTVRLENKTVQFLIRTCSTGWELLTADHPQNMAPIESALVTAESVWGPDSVCTLWKLGTAMFQSGQHHIFCLDSATIATDLPGAETGNPGPGLEWISENDFFSGLEPALLPVMEKIRLLK